jgi:uncharacterized protein (TIGR02270 family)
MLDQFDPTSWQSSVIPRVVEQHAESAKLLFSSRTLLATAPHRGLRHLGRLDTRLGANLDGLRIAWNEGDQTTLLASNDSVGAIFTTAVVALQEAAWEEASCRLIPLAMRAQTAMRGLAAAFGWVSSRYLAKLAAQLLTASEPQLRALAISACGMHRVDPGFTGAKRLEDDNALVRARAWRTTGEIGKREFVSAAASMGLSDSDPHSKFWAAWSAVLLGDRLAALDLLFARGAKVGPERSRAFQLALQAATVQSAHNWLATLNRDPGNLRWLIRGAGLIGDPKYIPWLIEQMTELKTTRLAGESFSLITGLDLAWLDLEVKPPENFESGPNDDPNDPNVEKIKNWWQANAQNFKAGTRYFMGQPLNRDNCLQVLKEGFQRQRIAAAYYLSLLNPGTPLFEWRAPAWRQQRLLAQMT